MREPNELVKEALTKDKLPYLENVQISVSKMYDAELWEQEIWVGFVSIDNKVRGEVQGNLIQVMRKATDLAITYTQEKKDQ